MDTDIVERPGAKLSPTEGMQSSLHHELRYRRLSFLAVILLGVAGTAPSLTAQQGAGASGGVTHLKVTNQVILPGVTRLGINLGEQNYYDSGQMMKNLLFRNPGFEGMSYRSILHCNVGGPARCLDTQQGFAWASGFWDGAGYEVLDGAAYGRRGKVLTSGPSGGGYGFGLDAGGAGRVPAIAAGDWLAVTKDFPGDPAAGWWPSVNGGARLEAERKDLSPSTLGHQALRIVADGTGQSAQIKSFFDTSDGYTFVRLQGRYRLSFRAKGLGGARTVHLHVARLVNGETLFLDQDVRLAPSWADYHADFTASEEDAVSNSPKLAGPVEVSFDATGSLLLLDDVSLEQTDGDAANQTAFRDEVVHTLKELNPGVLRLMSSANGLGSTVDNLLAPALARQRSGYSVWSSSAEEIPVGIPEFLELCQAIGAEPWIVVPTAVSKDEARKLAEYLSGGAETAGGAIRVAGGRREPWTRTFRTIHIELGNETWNGIFKGETMDEPAAYGRRANQVFTAFRAAAGADGGRFDLAVGSQAAWAGRNIDLLAAAPQANSLTIAPYLMHSVTKWANDDELYGPLLAQPEQMSRDGIVQQAQSSAGGRQLAVYEVNLHTTEGTATQAVLDRFTPSAAAGVAVAGHMLRMMRDHGVRDEMLFALSQFRFKRGDGTPVRLWGSVVEMGVNGRMRPQFLAVAMANRVMRGNLVRVEVTGQDPTHDQPEGNDGVQLRGVHEIDAYGFQDGKSHGLIIFNFGLHDSRRVSVEGSGLASNLRVNLWRLTSSGPGASNENTPQVKSKEDRLTGGELTLAPCSMAVLEWQE